MSYVPDEQGSPSLGYDYVQRPSSAINPRHVSDPMARPPSRGYYGDDIPSQYSGGGDPDSLDPFQFQTAGPRAASRRPQSGVSVSGPARSTRSRRSVYDETSDEDFIPSEDGSSNSDELGNGARIRESAIVVEESPEPERPSSKKKDSSPVKRKPVASRGKKKKR